MNLAQVHSPLYEYAPVAMARFATAKATYSKKRDLLGGFDYSRPIIRVPMQKILWEVLEAATEPLTMQQMYAASGQNWNDKEMNSARVFISGWRSDGWLVRSGVMTMFAYSIRGRA